MPKFCYNCGQQAELNDEGYYTCPEHKQLWLLHRNATNTDVAIVKNNQIVLVLRKNDPFKGYWCLPGGFQNFGEHPAATAIREVREETGASVEPYDVMSIWIHRNAPEDVRQATIIAAHYVEGELRAGDDAQDCKWWNLDDLPELIIPFHRQAVEDYFAKKSNARELISD